MVMGSVQSGKTANYTGLISKAIDAGYKLVVVLAGVHNSLRSQTQYRLNEEILGYDSDKIEVFEGAARRIGVRYMFRDHRIVQTLTSSNEKGDFRKIVASQAGIVPSPTGHPTIMVVKKHVSILKNLIDWSTAIIGLEDDSGRRVVTDVPLLVIDDECDYATVNTKKVVKDEDGIILEDCDPAKTNQRIRELLNAFQKSAYVGYTATPFANIFIHHEDKHPTYGEDLFPRNFIISLPQPSNYMGPERVFGLLEHKAIGLEAEEPLPLVRELVDSESIIPRKHNKDLVVGYLPESLKEAIKAFLIVCAVRRFRKVHPPHNSMLIHVTRFTNVQDQIRDLVQKEFRRYASRIQNRNDSLDDFRELWETDFVPTSRKLYEEFPHKESTWKEVFENLYPVIRRVRIKTINGTVKDSLDYRDTELDAQNRMTKGEAVPWEELGEHVIAIGGDKLSRGLTLDGLTVSYYLRASRMYDTLMQMGRWFGYRDGYEDLCRIYSTRELAGWYRYIATASLELRRELEYMALIDEEPKHFGLKVLSHPGQLIVTSVGKRRNAERLDLSYSGRMSETVVFDLAYTRNNLAALSSLVSGLRQTAKRNDKTKSALHWTHTPPEIVIQFLNTYETQRDAARLVNPNRIARFIEEQLRFSQEDLTEWDVALISRRTPPIKHTLSFDGTEIGCVERKPLSLSGNNLTIRRIVSPSDEWIDFSDQEKEDALERWRALRIKSDMAPPETVGLPSGPAIRAARPKRRGLMLIYVICYDEHDQQYGLKKGGEVLGFAVSFPSSSSTKQVRYEVNSVYQDAEDSL